MKGRNKGQNKDPINNFESIEKAESLLFTENSDADKFNTDTYKEIVQKNLFPNYNIYTTLLFILKIPYECFKGRYEASKTIKSIINEMDNNLYNNEQKLFILERTLKYISNCTFNEPVGYGKNKSYRIITLPLIEAVIEIEIAQLTNKSPKQVEENKNSLTEFSDTLGLVRLVKPLTHREVIIAYNYLVKVKAKEPLKPTAWGKATGTTATKHAAYTLDKNRKEKKVTSYSYKPPRIDELERVVKSLEKYPNAQRIAINDLHEIQNS